MDREATLQFARDHLALDEKVMEAYEKENGIATKGGLNMLYHVYEVSQQVPFKGALEFRKNCGVAADGTSSNTGVNCGFFTLLQQLVTGCQGRKLLRNNCLGHRIALVMKSAAESVDYIRLSFQPLIEEFFRFINNSAVRNKAMQTAFVNLGLAEVAVLCAFFTRWLSHGKCVRNMHHGLAGMLSGLKDISQNRNDADCAKAAGLRHQMGSFMYIATVELLFDVFEPIDIYKKQLQAREQTHAENVAHYRACVERVTAMHTDIKSCPALLYMLDQIKTGQISSEYIRELDGVDMSNAAAVDEWLGDKTLKFDGEIRKPFLSGVLRELRDRVEDQTMATLCRVDRIVLPADVLEFPAKHDALLKQAQRDARKRAKQAAADAALKHARALALAAGNSSDEEEEHVENKMPVTVPSAAAVLVPDVDLKETAEAAAAFVEDAVAVAIAFGLSSDEVEQLKSEHAAWRSYLMHAQQELIASGSRFPIRTVLDVTNNRVFRVNLASNRAVFKMHALLLDTSASNLEVSVEPERGFSFMNATKTISRNRIGEKQLNNLMVVGLHSPSVCAAASDARVHEELEAFISLCMKEWDSVKGRRCRSKRYNKDKDKQKVVSERKKRTRQQSLEASSFAVLATVKAKKKKEEEEAGEHAQAEGGSVSSRDTELANFKNIKTSTPAAVRLKQGNLAIWAMKIASDAGQRQDDHIEKVKNARKEKKDKARKEKNKKKRKPEDEAIRAEARWEDRAQRQDGAAYREGKIISIAETKSGRKRKVTTVSVLKN